MRAGLGETVKKKKKKKAGTGEDVTRHEAVCSAGETRRGARDATHGESIKARAKKSATLLCSRTRWYPIISASERQF